jgi:hypothetical protein
MIEDLKRVIKETLTPDEYQVWQNRMKEYEDNKKHCLIEAFFRHQETLPPAQRKDYCHISCPCPNCSPSMDPDLTCIK